MWSCSTELGPKREQSPNGGSVQQFRKPTLWLDRNGEHFSFGCVSWAAAAAFVCLMAFSVSHPTPWGVNS